MKASTTVALQKLKLEMSEMVIKLDLQDSQALAAFSRRFNPLLDAL